MNHLVVKAYREMKKNQAISVTSSTVEGSQEEVEKLQTNRNLSNASEVYSESKIVTRKNFPPKMLTSSVSLSLIQKLQLLVVNLPFYKRFNSHIKVKAFDHVKQIQDYAKIHGEIIAKDLKEAITSIFSYAELKNIYSDLKQGKSINYAYSKLRSFFEALTKVEFSFSYDILGMLCEYMEVEQTTSKTV